ncbi:MAG: hypothetical protein ACKVS5_13385 [Parvularculaceae bacterium]
MFWIRAFADDIYNKPVAFGDKVTLKDAPQALFLWCFFAAFSLFMTANIVGSAVERVIDRERHWFSELRVINYNDISHEDLKLTYSKIAWHFFFHEGKLQRESLAECQSNVGEAATVVQDVVCPIDAITTHSSNPTGVDTCGRAVGTSFRGISENEALKRLKGSLRTAAVCASLEKRKSVPLDALYLIVQSSQREWKGCSNDVDLNKALRGKRLEHIRDQIDKAKATATDEEKDRELATLISTITINEVDAKAHLDFSDALYEEHYTAKGGSGDPYDVTQSAALILNNPAGCRLYPPDQTARAVGASSGSP